MSRLVEVAVVALDGASMISKSSSLREAMLISDSFDRLYKQKVMSIYEKLNRVESFNRTPKIGIE